MNRHANNFDCIRLLAALAVFISHQAKLAGHGSIEVSNYHDLGKTGVLVFFSISGYLVAQSWERDPRPWPFLARRFLRIWPALACVVLLTVFVLGPATTSLPLRDYFAAPQTFGYLGHLLLIIQERLPGVFSGHAIERVNGPLWTIPIEAGWYAVLALLGVLGMLRYRCTMPLILLACGVYVFGIYGTENQETAPFWELEFGLFFLYGASMHYMRSWWQPRPRLAALALLALAAASLALGHEYIAIVIALPYCVIAVACASTPFVRDAGRWGDFSYGIYIYSFPIQQAVMAAGGNALGLAGSTAVALPATVLLAWLSWRFVEEPALGLKRYLQARPQSAIATGASGQGSAA